MFQALLSRMARPNSKILNLLVGRCCRCKLDLHLDISLGITGSLNFNKPFWNLELPQKELFQQTLKLFLQVLGFLT